MSSIRDSSMENLLIIYQQHDNNAFKLKKGKKLEFISSIIKFFVDKLKCRSQKITLGGGAHIFRKKLFNGGLGAIHL